MMKAPTLSHTILPGPVSKWQYTVRSSYAGKLCTNDPSKIPFDPNVISTLYLPSIGEVSLNENPMLNEL